MLALPWACAKLPMAVLLSTQVGGAGTGTPGAGDAGDRERKGPTVAEGAALVKEGVKEIAAAAASGVIDAGKEVAGAAGDPLWVDGAGAAWNVLLWGHLCKAGVLFGLCG
jgi:hypothetical protein